jgi:hypothetical protein
VPTVSDIFAACDRAGVRLWREGDSLRFRSPGGLPVKLAEMLKAHKADVLACLPDGFGWYRGGAMRNRPPDYAGACRYMAEWLGWPDALVPDPRYDGQVFVIQGGQHDWATFIGGNEECVIAAAMLELEPAWLALNRGAA